MSYKLHFKQTKDSSVPTACNQNNSCQSHQSFKFKSIHYKKIFMKTPLHPRSPCSAGFHALSFDHGSLSNQTWLSEHENQQQQGQFFPQSSSSSSSSTSTPGQVAKPRPIASLMHQPWCEGATANQTWHKSGNRLKKTYFMQRIWATALEGSDRQEPVGAGIRYKVRYNSSSKLTMILLGFCFY